MCYLYYFSCSHAKYNAHIEEWNFRLGIFSRAHLFAIHQYIWAIARCSSKVRSLTEMSFHVDFWLMSLIVAYSVQMLRIYNWEEIRDWHLTGDWNIAFPPNTLSNVLSRTFHLCLCGQNAEPDLFSAWHPNGGIDEHHDVLLAQHNFFA